VTFQQSWRIGLKLLDRSRKDVPFGWVAGDDAFGRASAFRAELRCRRLRYVLDVPTNTLIGELSAVPAPVGLREVFARLLQPEPPSPQKSAEKVSRVLRRNEEARIDHCYKATGKFPPRRRRPDG
jgi:hypothetical protein